MDRFNDYLSNHYLENFPHSNEFNHHRIVNGKTFYPLLQIQKYDQNSGHFNTWHIEQEDKGTSDRVFVFILCRVWRVVRFRQVMVCCRCYCYNVTVPCN